MSNITDFQHRPETKHPSAFATNANHRQRTPGSIQILSPRPLRTLVRESGLFRAFARTTAGLTPLWANIPLTSQW
jgi:hypothetical protein